MSNRHALHPGYFLYDGAMPCYLFTFHAYLSWLPDRKRGYVKRGQGILLRATKLAQYYRNHAKEKPAIFDAAIQRILIEETLLASSPRRFVCYAIATDFSHLHILLSWRDTRNWQRMRKSLRTSLSLRLNKAIGKRTWFVENSSPKHVLNRGHFNYLVGEYLPKHQGLRWYRSEPDNKE